MQSLTFVFDPRSRRCYRTCSPRGTFRSKETCDSVCRSVKVCNAPRPLAYCAGTLYYVYYYDPRSGQCYRTRSCTFSGNNFPDRRECEKTCMKWRHQPKPVMVGGNWVQPRGSGNNRL
uniref:BPTI/Kunitz inhibitor domain-containing protein n=1 Tax=Amblyomma maculatum TaxID=34609 RepID=G3MS03_AMBMU